MRENYSEKELLSVSKGTNAQAGKGMSSWNSGSRNYNVMNKRVFLNWSYRWLWVSVWVLDTESGFSGRAAMLFTRLLPSASHTRLNHYWISVDWLMWVDPKDEIRSTFKNDIGKDSCFSSRCDQTLECYGVRGSHCGREGKAVCVK